MSLLKQNFEQIYDKYHLNGKYNTFSKFHLDSFNKFVNEDITAILLGYNPIVIEESKNDRAIVGTLTFTDIYFNPPHCIDLNKNKVPIYPNECRLNNKNYEFTIHAHYKFTITERIGNGPEKLKVELDSSKGEPFILGKVPAMVKSQLCSLYGLTSKQLKIIKEDEDELGCYFIVGGNEYAIIPQENKAENFIFKNIELTDKKKEYTVWIQSKKPGKYNYPFYTIVSLYTVNEIPTVDIAITISKSKGSYIPMKAIFMALGIITDEDIFNLIGQNEDSQVQQIIEEILRVPIYLKGDEGTVEVKTKKDAILYIISMYKISNQYYVFNSKNEDAIIKNFIFELNEKQLFPHIGGESEIRKKALFLGQMIKSSIRLYLGYDKPVDRDNYGNKRILGPGLLLGQLFKHSVDILITDAKNNIVKELKEFNQNKDYSMIVVNNFKEKKINMAKNISTGKWPAGFTKQEKEGISQLREVKSQMDILAYLVKIMTPVLDANTTNISMRALQDTHWGVICPADTPDGQNVGLIKHLAHLAVISEFSPEKDVIREIIKYDGIVDIDFMDFADIWKYMKIFINGIWRYCIPFEDAKTFANDLIVLRRAGIIHRYTSIVRNYEDHSIKILTDNGRILQPLIIVDREKKALRLEKSHYDDLKNDKLTFDDLLNLQLLEYIDIHELEHNCLVAETEEDILAWTYSYTHCMIDETAILSINTLMNPFGNYNQGPRLSFEDTMRKQTVGISLSNYMYRMDTSLMILPYAERPLVRSIGEKYSGLDRHPYGKNICIVIGPAGGYNLDDASVVNKDTMISNDIMTVINYKTYTDELQGNDEDFMKPVESKCLKYKTHSSYEAINNKGYPIIGAIVNKGDIIVGHIQHMTKTEREENKGKYEYVDRSAQYNEGMQGVIEEYLINENEDGVQTIKIKIRIHRQLKCGDKLASTASQKGIVSLLFDGEEMPFAEDGSRPDILFNPHGIITRMTMSHLFEVIGANIALANGTRLDATPFCRITLDELIEALKEAGLSDWGEETMFDGKTGLSIKCKMYKGFIYYQRLKHMVDDKIFARSTGPVVPKTHQPIHGRKMNGGLKVGGMEKDAVECHGSSMTLKEFFFDKSDRFEEYVSGKSGMFCTGNAISQVFEDKGNPGSIDIDHVKIPWTTKMLKEYINAMGIDMSLQTESDTI